MGFFCLVGLLVFVVFVVWVWCCCCFLKKAACFQSGNLFLASENWAVSNCLYTLNYLSPSSKTNATKPNRTVNLSLFVVIA